MSQSDQDLAARLRNGEEDALKRLFDLYFHDLVIKSAKIVINTGVAEEIVQDVFINLWRNRQSLTLEKEFKNYLLQAVRNRSLNYLKSRFGRQRFDDLKQVKDPPSHSTSEGDLYAGELRQAIQEAVARLPGKCRIIFSLSRNAGLTVREIAGQLDISEKTVRAQISIAVGRIRKELHDRSILPPG